MDAEQLVEVQQAASTIARAQFAYLVRRYGVDDRFRDGWGNHNATHNLRVAWQAARGAARLVEAGAEPPEAVPFALIAGIHHDHVQEVGSPYDGSPHRAALIEVDEQQAILRHQLERAGAPLRPLTYDLSPDRERLSVAAAHDAMRAYEREHGYEPTELFTQAGYDTVDELIMDTQVVGATPQDGIGTRSTADRPLGAAMSDADKSDLALQGGLRRGLGLLLERNRATLAVPAFSDGMDVDLPRELTVPYLESQCEIFANDRFTLSQSNALFPQRAFTVERLEQLRREHVAGRMTWTEMVAHTTELARTEPVPSRGAASTLIADPRDLIGDLAPGLRGQAPGVRSPEALPPELQTERDRAGIDLHGAVVLPKADGARATPRASVSKDSRLAR
ncbi:hypothetical protein [Kribbella kalugense]|uniref:Uncharacterized protein n=1 Tax=Kribbella kalugense TaxID=2512221 RepID=A0A4R7ZB00_9ACTN|nr:hypothetical protein [Kribbella kalugense]TDW14292.1 hypothetical protein EV650_7878 [Kribbella kalugense]